ncbi:MAG: penicillin-binding protein 1C [Candidatus Poribacteria bacterium]|nr:penicillin-binding protein 1C [Candidatus Poribacteria bacterium]
MKKIRMEDLGIGRLEDWKTGRLWDDPSFPLSILPFKRLFWLLPPLLLIILFMLANWCFPLPKARLHPPSSPIVLDKNGQWLRAFLAEDGMWRIAVSHQFPSAVSEIAINRSSEGFRESRVSESHSVLLHQAILTSEDRWFYYHYGINPVSIVTALYDNLKAGKVVRGGSTITMQLARLMEPKARNIPNKLIEAFRALQLEHAYSKSEILNFYFNMLPYGGNIVGIGAASRFYFNKPQHALSLGEAALLAAIPNAPERLRPDRFPENARKAREKVLNRLLARGQISKQQWQEASQEPIPKKRYPLPFKAPHLSRMLVRHAVPTTDGRIYTTIDTKVQETAVRILREYLDAAGKPSLQGSHSAGTGAIVVMDTRSREVLAMVGSHDFFDRRASGQINGTLAPRSPGSALKPFVYALAMEQGLITPETLLFDVPISYAGYEPVNYDGKYNGYVTARQALARSLNVPAVNLNALLKNITLPAFLKQAGISTFAPDRKYGLSMVLGGCEVNLLELTTLYAGLANMGEFEPYQLTRRSHQSSVISGQLQEEIKHSTNSRQSPVISSQSQEVFGKVNTSLTDNRKLKTENYSKKRLLRAETSFIITEMLTTSQRPANAVKSLEVFESTMNLPKIAWKTGTSYGHRDAWCIGYSPTLTIGVWLGNFDGRGSPMLSGTDAATPILFALFTALTGQDTHRWFTKPEQLKTRQVCALSGAPVSPHCPTHKSDVYIPGISPVATCAIHKRIYINETTGYSLCSHCRNFSTDNAHRKIFEEWPAEAATWLAENGFAVPVLPEHNPLCTGTIAGNAPIILSPAEDTTYYIRTGVPLGNQKIRLSASTSNRTQNLFWFLDGELIFKGKAGEEHWFTPVKGKHVLTCVDAEGRSASRPLHISMIQ